MTSRYGYLLELIDEASPELALVPVAKVFYFIALKPGIIVDGKCWPPHPPVLSVVQFQRDLLSYPTN